MRHILHCDMNAFYASVEIQRHPELRGKPVAVCGSQEERHGIVLTANYIAKPRGVKTGMAIWQAKQVCPDLVILPPDMAEYIRISRYAQEIYEDYTDQVEPSGLDESWLDVTGSVGLYGSPMAIAQEISSRIKKELGITASIGVANNKITAKLGSDYKKPDADVYKRQSQVFPTCRAPRMIIGRRYGSSFHSCRRLIAYRLSLIHIYLALL